MSLHSVHLGSPPSPLQPKLWTFFVPTFQASPVVPPFVHKTEVMESWRNWRRTKKLIQSVWGLLRKKPWDSQWKMLIHHDFSRDPWLNFFIIYHYSVFAGPNSEQKFARFLLSLNIRPKPGKNRKTQTKPPLCQRGDFGKLSLNWVDFSENNVFPIKWTIHFRGVP